MVLSVQMERIRSRRRHGEPASSFIHGYTDTFIKFLKKHPEIDRELSLIKDCVTREDLQAQEEAPIAAESIRDKI